MAGPAHCAAQQPQQEGEALHLARGALESGCKSYNSCNSTRAAPASGCTSIGLQQHRTAGAEAGLESIAGSSSAAGRTFCDARSRSRRFFATALRPRPSTSASVTSWSSCNDKQTYVMAGDGQEENTREDSEEGRRAHLDALHPEPVEANHVLAGFEPELIQEAREKGHVQLLHAASRDPDSIERGGARLKGRIRGTAGALTRCELGFTLGPAGSSGVKQGTGSLSEREGLVGGPLGVWGGTSFSLWALCSASLLRASSACVHAVRDAPRASSADAPKNQTHHYLYYYL